MSNTRKRLKPILAALEADGFEVLGHEATRGCHVKIFVRDQARKEFFLITGWSASEHEKRLINNIVRDARRMSAQRLK